MRDLFIGVAGSFLAMLLSWIFRKLKEKYQGLNSKLQGIYVKEKELIKTIPPQARIAYTESRKLSLFTDCSEFACLALVILFLYSLLSSYYAQFFVPAVIGFLFGHAFSIFLKARRIEDLMQHWVLLEISELKQNDQPNE